MAQTPASTSKLEKAKQSDALVANMVATGAPLTREEYLRLNYLGNVPEEIPAEDEAEFPEIFQLRNTGSKTASVEDEDDEVVVDASEFED